MRVHYIVNHYSAFGGGAERLARTLHQILREKGIDSHVLGLMAQRDNHLEGAWSLGLKSPYHPQAVRDVFLYVHRQVVLGDIVHVHLFPSLFYVALAAFLQGQKGILIYTEHSTSNRRRGTRWGRWLDRFMYARYEHIIAISKGVEEKLLAWQPQLKGRTRVIYNGVPLRFHEVLRRPRPSRPVVLSVGNLRPAKNYDTALKAVALLKDLDFEYWIAGTGPSEPELLRLSRDLGLEGRVRFLGYVHPQEMPALLKNVHIFLMPSRREGFGLAAVEAMNASLPLVVSDVPGLREVAETQPPCAVFVDPHSPASIAAGLRLLLLDHDLRLNLGRNAFHRSKVFSMERMVENYLSLYRYLAGREA